MSIKKRLEALVENPVLKANKRDYDFALSLRNAYLRQGRLTPGRRPWLDKLEHKYSEAEISKRQLNLDSDMVSRLENLHSKMEDKSSWNYGFVESVLNQVRSNYSLSDRQLQIIEKIESENTEEALAERRSFSDRYNDPSSGMKVKAKVAATYYLTTPYFRDIASMVANVDDFVPTFAQYNKLVENKYAKKIIDGYLSEPKFDTGSLVQFRATAPTKRNKKAMVIVANYRTPVSPSAGNKVYQVLPLGEAVPVVIEEKHLKKWRTPKNEN